MISDKPSRHLIADNLGWFKDDTENGKLRTVEDILKARGETVKRGVLPLKFNTNQTIELTPDDVEGKN